MSVYPQVIRRTPAVGNDAGTGTGTPSRPEDAWLKPNPEAAALFNLETRSGKITTDLWKFFHVVTGVKEDADQSDLPTKWNKIKCFGCCNSCGDLVVVGNMDPRTGKPTQLRNTGMHSHLESGKHTTTVEKLVEETSRFLVAGKSAGSKRKAEHQTIAQFMKEKTEVPLKLRQPTQELMTTKFVVDNALPFSIVESPSFRSMITAHNKHAKVMSNKKVKTNIINLDDTIRKAAIEKMKGESVCFTLDHWTSKANQNYTGMTGHFIDDEWKLHGMPVATGRLASTQPFSLQLSLTPEPKVWSLFQMCHPGLQSRSGSMSSWSCLKLSTATRVLHLLLML